MGFFIINFLCISAQYRSFIFIHLIVVFIFLIGLQYTRIIWVIESIFFFFIFFLLWFYFKNIYIHIFEHKINNSIIILLQQFRIIYTVICLLSLFLLFLIDISFLRFMSAPYWRNDVIAVLLLSSSSNIICFHHAEWILYFLMCVGSVHIVWWIPIGIKSNVKESYRPTSTFNGWKYDCFIASTNTTIYIRYTTIEKRWVWFDRFKCGQLSWSTETISTATIIEHQITNTMCTLYVYWRVWTLVRERWINIW